MRSAPSVCVPKSGAEIQRTHHLSYLDHTALSGVVGFTIDLPSIWTLKNHDANLGWVPIVTHLIYIPEI